MKFKRMYEFGKFSAIEDDRLIDSSFQRVGEYGYGDLETMRAQIQWTVDTMSALFAVLSDEQKVAVAQKLGYEEVKHDPR